MVISEPCTSYCSLMSLASVADEAVLGSFRGFAIVTADIHIQALPNVHLISILTDLNAIFSAFSQAATIWF